MSVHTVPLPPTRAFARRVATLVRGPGAAAVTGVLEIREAVTPNAKAHTLRYRVAEVPPLTPGGRDFELRLPSGMFCYRAQVPDDPREYPACGCGPYTANGWCRHVEALCALAAAGHLAPPPF